MDETNADALVVPSLAAVLAQVPDPRGARGRRHPWPALLFLVVVALLCGANTQRAWARWGRHAGWPALHRLGFTRAGGPSRATLSRLLQRVDVAALEAALSAWLQQVRATWRRSAARWLDGIAIDGKTLRGASRLGATDAHLVSACCHRWGLVLGEVAVTDQTNELGALAPLLAQLTLAGETLTFDALFTQTAVATDVVARGGAYLMVVKGNQPTLWRACAEATAARPCRPRRRLGEAHTTHLAHGRVEQRTLLAVAAPPDLGVPHARQGLRLQRRRTSKRTGAVLTDETVYAITSLSPEQASPRQVLTLWRHHWRVENQVHWVRDVVFGEDASTTRTGTAPQALAALRNLALSLLRAWRRPDITAARQYYAGRPAALFRQLGLRRL
jgi:predicted transposase YbfD/YdcC